MSGDSRDDSGSYTSENQGIETVAITCPVCGSRAVLNSYTRFDPISGRHVLRAIICRSCGLRHVEDYPIEDSPEFAGETHIVIEVGSPRDFSKLIFKSSRAHITIPEIGLEIIPTNNSVDEILTVDGLIEKIIDHLEPLCPETDDPARCREIIEWLNKAWRGDVGFTIEIYDPSKRTKVFTLG